MSHQNDEALPHAPFPLVHLKGIEQVVWAYSQYLRKFPTNAQTTKRIQTLEHIRERLAAQLCSEEVKLVLNVEELEELLRTLQDFAKAIKRILPQNEQRDAVICSVETWRLYLIQIIQAAHAC
jgi:N-glycosylase/DNA lyase